MSKPNLLIVTGILPIVNTGGSNARTCQIIKSLYNHFNIDLLVVTSHQACSKKEDLLSGYTKSTNYIYWKYPSKKETLKNYIKSWLLKFPFNFNDDFSKEVSQYIKSHYQPDMILIQKSVIAAIFIHNKLLDNYSKIPVVLDEDALPHIRYMREACYGNTLLKKIKNKVRAWRILEFYEKYFKLFDKIVVVSKDEIEVLLKYFSKEKLCLIENGVTFCQKICTFNEMDLAIFGPFSYPPNLHSLEWFFNKVYPGLCERGFNQKIYVVGSNPPALINEMSKKDSRIIVTGFVDDINEIYDKVSIVLCPIWKGAGTRTKVLEALAYGKALISTTIGCEGIEVENDKEILIRNTPEEFIETIIDLLNNKSKVNLIGENSRKLIERRYLWSDVLEPLKIELSNLLN